MYLATLRLPPHITEAELEALGPVFEDFACAYYVSREIDNDERTDWLARWIIEDPREVSLLAARIPAWNKNQNMTIAAPESNWTVEKIDETRDWLAESYKGFQPFDIGPFFIYGSHYNEELPQDLIPLQIDAATAFGSGEHGTTAGCLEFLAELKQGGFTPDKTLDMGCGSGILAIAACKLWNTPALGVDIDPEAVSVAVRHRDLNNVAASLNPCAAGPGFETPQVESFGPYDLIIANILAAPLKDMAPDIARLTTKHGYALLSGMLVEQSEDVRNIYQQNGFTTCQHKHINGWATLLLKR